MTFDPTRAFRRKENALEFSDSKVGHFAGQLRIQRLMKSLGDLIFDEVGPRNIAEQQSGQLTACFPAHVVIPRAANVHIALFEFVGERKCLAKLVASHGEESF